MATSKNNPKSATNKKAPLKSNPSTAKKKTTTVKTKATTTKTSTMASAISMPVFSLPTNHVIPKDTGSKMILALEDLKIGLNFDIPLAFNFNKNIFESFLQIENCDGIRIYFGLNDDNQLAPIITGVDSDGNDVYLTSKTNSDIFVGDMGQACPLYDASKIQLP